MRADEIDELLINFKNIEFDPNGVFERYAGITVNSLGDEEKVKSASKIIMAKIEEGDYNYFKQLINEGNKDLLKFMRFSTKINDIKEFISDREKLGLDSEILKDLIIATGETAYIKSCVENREQLGLNANAIKDLIIAVGEPEYTHAAIVVSDILGLDSEVLNKLIIETIDNCIANNISLKPYNLKETNIDTNIIKNYIDNRQQLQLSTDILNDLIIATGEPDYIRDCVNDRENLGLTKDNIKDLIIATDEPDYIKICIDDRGELGLTISNIKDLIIATGELDYIKNCIDGRADLELESKELVDLVLSTGDLQLIEQYQNKAEEFGIKPEDCKKLSMITKKTQITLPPNMTIGVEIESEGIDTKTIKRLLEGKNWTTKGDGSLREGTEVVSDILTGNTEFSSNEIKSVCAVLNGVGQNISDRCGGHIHIGANYLTSRQDWNNLIQIWGNAEKVLYIISNEEGNIPRDGVPQYARPISKKIDAAIEQGTINLEGEEDLERFVSQISITQGDRYSGINFKNVNLGQKKNTIEFRLPNGTLNPNTWIENINLFGGIIRSAHELTAIQEKPEDQRTETERKTLECFEVLQTEQDEEKVLQALLELCVAPEQKQLYMDRYEVNRPLIEGSPTFNNALTEQISTNKIGKKSLAGKEPITGEDYQKGASYIEAELARNEVSQGLGQGGE